MKSERTNWALKWRSKNKIDGLKEFFMFNAATYDDQFYSWIPMLFENREKARQYLKKHYRYLAKRKDLRAEPYGWRVPRIVRVVITIEEK